jgi:hypothetical protein
MTPSHTKDAGKLPFPAKLYRILRDAEGSSHGDIIAWLPDGKSFKIHSEQKFCDVVMKHYFTQTNLKSFTRQLYLYGFLKMSSGPDSGVFYHPRFIRSDPQGSMSIKRNQFKGDRRQSKTHGSKTKKNQEEKASPRFPSKLKPPGWEGGLHTSTFAQFAPTVSRFLPPPMRSVSVSSTTSRSRDNVDRRIQPILSILDQAFRVMDDCDAHDAPLPIFLPQNAMDVPGPIPSSFGANEIPDDWLFTVDETSPSNVFDLDDLLAPRPIEEMIRSPLSRRNEACEV